MRTLGFPQKMVVHLPYREHMSLATGTSGNPTIYQFNLTSLYDPNRTGAGQQPRYYDQLATATLYNRYRVYKADISVTFRNRATSDMQVSCFIRDDPSLVPSNSNVMFYNAEFPYTATRMLNGTGDGGDKNRTTFKFSVDTAKFFGISKTTFYGDNNFRGAYNSSPARMPILSCAISDDPAEVASGLTCDIEVSIVYHALLYDLAQEVAQS